MPAATIKIQSFWLKEFKENPSNFFKKNPVAIKNSAIITERIIVARVESISFKPSLANTATKAAAIEEIKA